MVVSSIVRSVIVPSVRYIVGQDGLLSQAIDALGGVTPLHYWDFTTNRALFSGADVGAVTSTPGYSFTRATVGTADDLAGNIVQFASGEIRRTDRGILVEDARTNLFLNSAVGVTQSITVAAAAHTLSFRGTGTISLTGVSTAGPLVGSGVNTRVTLTFTPTAGSLTLTISGSCTNVQLEAGSSASSWIPTTGASVTRDPDVLTVSSPGVDFPLTLFVEFERAVDTGAAVQLFRLDDGNENERALLGINVSDLARTTVTDGGVVQADVTVAGALAVNTIYKQAGALSTNRVQTGLNGVLGTEDTAATMSATPSAIRFGVSLAGVNQPFSYIRRAAIFNTALADAALQAVTS